MDVECVFFPVFPGLWSLCAVDVDLHLDSVFRLDEEIDFQSSVLEVFVTHLINGKIVTNGNDGKNLGRVFHLLLEQLHL
ncbi:unnamed protein product [Leuciscus chuanchicus]